MQPSATDMTDMTPITPGLLGLAGRLFASVALLLAAVWSGVALWYRAPGGATGRFSSVLGWVTFSAGAAAAIWRGHGPAGTAAFAAGFAVLLAWWVRLTPTQDGAWADDVAELTTAAIDGDRVTVHNVRNFDWRTATDFTRRWETRVYDLSRLRSVDMIMSYWRGPAIAHMLISFGFEDGAQLVFSVEIRRKKTQQFSEIGGFFKEFELCVMAGDELDMVRLRTNVRRERVYLFRLAIGMDVARRLLLGYLAEANSLARTPRFYNTITVNCTTFVYRMLNRIVGHLPLSYRVLFSGYMPEYVHAVGFLDRRHSLEELRARGYASERGLRSAGGAGYSADIRRGVPGIDD
jgi:hypothetical protein